MENNETPKPPPIPAHQEIKAQETMTCPRNRLANEKFCESCGQIVKLNMPACPHCGHKTIQQGLGCIPKAAIAIGVCFLMIPVIGILAAIAIPNFIAYRDKAFDAAVRAELMNLSSAQQSYYVDNNRYTANLDELNLEQNPQIQIEIIKADYSCYDAIGKHEKRANNIILMDCNGFKGENTY